MEFAIDFGIDPWILIMLCMASLSAGLIDAMAGGGGLIQVPALFALMPGVNHATLLGTNKTSSIVGTSYAAWRYGKVVRMPWNAALPAACGALVGALSGAYVVTLVSSQSLRLVLPWLLVLVAIYTYSKKDLGAVSRPRMSADLERRIAVCLGLGIGFYDGFFGPGTGTFLLVGFVALFGFEFLAATASAKLVNVACNFASLAWFAPSGHVMLGLGLLLACFNVIGAYFGSRLAIRKGAGFIRRVLLCVVGVLIMKTAYDSYVPLFFN